MFNFREFHKRSALLLMVFALLSFGEVRAGLIDKMFRRKAAGSQAKTEFANSSPITQISASEPAEEPADATPEAPPLAAGSGVPMSIMQQSDCPAPAMKTPFERTFQCFNCGEDDCCQTGLRNCRKTCHQTWYPRVAPYCQAGWGYTQPCWRRAEDTYACPRPQLPGAQPFSAPGADGPAPERLPQVPAVPPQSASRR